MLTLRSGPRKILVVLVVLLMAGSSLLAYDLVSFFAPKPLAEPPFTVTVLKTSADLVDAPAGMAWYLLEVNYSVPGPNPNHWHSTVYPSDFRVITNQSRNVQSSQSYNVTSLMQTTDVLRGTSVVGVVAFLLQDHEGPVTLTSPTGCVDNCGFPLLVNASVPPVSAFASRFGYNVRMSINGQPVAAGGWTVVGSNSSTPWVSSLILNGVIENTTGFLVLGGKGVEDPSDYVVFFTGQTVQVNLWFEYLKKPADPTTIHLDSVTNDQGFQVLNVSPMPPVSMTGWGFQEGLVVLLRIPPGQHSGSLGFSVQASS